MQLENLLPLLHRIHGATFATLDAETKTKGLIKKVHGLRVILFRTKGGSGYEAKVKRHLAEVGIDPDGFSVGPLPWGERVGDLPLIHHNESHYLQCIPLNEPEAKYFMPGNIPVHDPSVFGIRRRPINPDLPENKQVHVSCYNVENIKRIALLGEELFDSGTQLPSRKILTPNYERNRK